MSIILVAGSVDLNDGVNTVLLGMSLGKPSRAAREISGPNFDLPYVGPPDTSSPVESRFRIGIVATSVDSALTIVDAIAQEASALSPVTIGLDGSAHTGTITPRVAECVEVPMNYPYDVELMRDFKTVVELVIRRNPSVLAATETLYDAAAFTMPTVAALDAQTGELPTPLDMLLDFETRECVAFYAGWYPLSAAVWTIDKFLRLAVQGSWSGGAASTDAAGYPWGIATDNTIWRNQSATEVYGDFGVTDLEPGEYLAVARCKGTVANTCTIRHSFGSPILIPSTSLSLLPLGVVPIPTRAVVGSAAANVRIYIAGDGTNYAALNYVVFIPISFGGLIGWRKSSGHAHTLRWEDEMVYADGIGDLGNAFSGRALRGLRGCVVAVAEEATAVPTTHAHLTVTA